VRGPLALLLAAAALAPAVATAAPAAVVVRLSPSAVVEGDDVALADVADVTGDTSFADRVRALRVMPSPAAGTTQPLGAETVRARLLSLGPDGARVQLAGVRTLVTRAHQVVRGADVVDAVRRHTRPRLEAAELRGEASALVPIARPEDLRVPTGEVSFEVRVHEGAAAAVTMAATVVVRVNGRERHQAVLTFQLARLVNVIVATRALEPRRTLGASDFRHERRPVGEVPPDFMSEVSEPEELEVLRPLQAGEVLTPRVIRQRFAVKRGELVTLLLEGDGFRITTQGQVNDDARRGDAVRVLNVASKREVIGWVEGGGVVRVPYRKLGAGR
jgi:flagella basal body P-ring formation protein FlgA